MNTHIQNCSTWPINLHSRQNGGDDCLNIRTPVFLQGVIDDLLYEIQGSRSPKFGAEIWPHSQSQKVYFFPNSR